MKITKRTIFVTFRRKGLHRFPGAATEHRLEDVKYLGDIHRHVFHFRVEIDVFHDDREIEFHQFLNWIEGLYNDKVLELDFMSCEMISDVLAERIMDKYPGRKLNIQVVEDGENGSDISYVP